MDSYDVIIIGSGAGGGTLAHRLAPSGKRILLLERGDWLAREPRNWSDQAVFVDNRYISPDTWIDRDGKEFQPQVHYFVGGATKLYGAALYRFRPQDFGELQHHGGTSPADQFCGSRGSQSPRSSNRIRLPEGARCRASVPPPAPVPTMITS